jgi:hypothetical protein
MKKIIFLKMFLLAFAINSYAQVRPNINSFTPAQRTLLANLMMQYITPAVIEDHCVMTMGIDDIHSDFNFLPFHRVYMEKMEDWLKLQPGGAQFVPLPYWNPELPGGVPMELRVIDPDCASANCDTGGTAPCFQTINWNPGNPLPQNLKLPTVSGSNNDICDHTFKPLAPTVDISANADGLSRRIETPWHNNVHNSMGGLFSIFRAPATPVFFLWHAYVDDVWKKWDCNCTQSGVVGEYDLYMKDNYFVSQKERDRGQEPNLDNGPMWVSEDIWVRNQNDGQTNQTHQNPEYMALPNNYNYVYVRVRNRGCIANTGAENLQLSWAKAGTALSWPNHWNGSITSPALMGNIISTQPIPVIPPGSSAIIEFAWQPPNPATYANIGTDPIFWANEPWHFCLLARVVSGTDTMTFTETSNLYANVQNNNNIVWKNISVVDTNVNNLPPSGEDVAVGATVIGGDAFGNGGLYNFEFSNPKYIKGNPITAEAEIKVTLDGPIWKKWANGGFQGANVKIINEEKHQLLITGDKATIKNLLFDPKQQGLIHVSFNFLAAKLSGQPEFDYNVIQTASLTNAIVGGERYHVTINGRKGFTADAGVDKKVSQNETFNLDANDIGEAAIYNWYDTGGKLIYTGKDFTVSAEITKKYKLEVIAIADGVKDYDEIEVKVKDAEIITMSPNPASSVADIRYNIVGAGSAYLIVTRPYSGIQNQYIVDPLLHNVSIDVTGMKTGVYSVILMCDGVAKDVKSLLVK